MRRLGPTGWATHEALGHCPPTRRPAPAREAAPMRLLGSLLTRTGAARLAAHADEASEAANGATRALFLVAGVADEVAERLDAMARGEGQVDAG